MAVQIQQRGDTAANWTAADPILADREVGWETDTGKQKLGDGTLAWTALGYVGAGGGVASVVAGTGITVDNTDPANPIVAATASAPAWGTITGPLSSQTDLQAALDAKGAAGVPQNSQSGAYTLVLSDANKHIYHPSADTTARIWTIPANGSVAFPIGTAVTFVNDTSAGVVTIAITTDTLVLAGSGATGSRTLAANGLATAIKVTSTRWMISGTGLT